MSPAQQTAVDGLKSIAQKQTGAAVANKATADAGKGLGRPFKQGYNLLKGIDRYIPVDVHIPGCPPRPEALIHAFMTLQHQ